jgi:hypothetical protein
MKIEDDEKKPAKNPQDQYIVISYAKGDKELVQQLEVQLQKLQYSVWKADIGGKNCRSFS